MPRLRAVQLIAVLALIVAAPASATSDAKAVHSMRLIVSHYRSVTWAYERAAHVRRTPTSFSERRSADPRYLRWAVERWTRHAYRAQHIALVRIERKLAVRLPRAPRLHARLSRRVSYNRRIALRLRRIYPGHPSRRFAAATRPTGAETLRLWQQRSALAAIAVARHAATRHAAVARRSEVPDWLRGAFLCIHRFEGPWTANSGNGYYGGLQMDIDFQGRYGAPFLRRWGTADNWPSWAQIETAARAYRAGRGFGPWPSTARACGLM